MIPAVITAADDALPLARADADAEAERIIRTEPISCAVGCSACCVQAVPVRPAEVRSTRRHIDTLADDERAVIEQRIHDAVARLRSAGLTGPPTDRVERRAMVERYFNTGVECPFLTDDGRCGIRPVRPLACREYLVASDPTHCGTYEGAVVRIRSARDPLMRFAKVSRALGETDSGWLAFAIAGPIPPAPEHAPVSPIQVTQAISAQRRPSPRAN